MDGDGQALEPSLCSAADQRPSQDGCDLGLKLKQTLEELSAPGSNSWVPGQL